MFRWGLIPPWATDPAIGHKMINARAETLSQKPSFRGPFEKSRCLVLADGFYEWARNPRGRGKTPMRIVLKSREPFAFAGLWDRWQDPKGGDIGSFTIITTEANNALRPIHDRMPVILKPDHEDPWLDFDTPIARLKEMLVPYPNDQVEAYPVSKLLNSPSNDTPVCIEPEG